MPRLSNRGARVPHTLSSASHAASPCTPPVCSALEARKHALTLHTLDTHPYNFGTKKWFHVFVISPPPRVW
jgi:hypothetical protein